MADFTRSELLSHAAALMAQLGPLKACHRTEPLAPSAAALEPAAPRPSIVGVVGRGIARILISLDRSTEQALHFRVVTRDGQFPLFETSKAKSRHHYQPVDTLVSFWPGQGNIVTVDVTLRDAGVGKTFEVVATHAFLGAFICKVTIGPSTPLPAPAVHTRPKITSKGEPVFTFDPNTFKAKDGGGAGCWDTALAHGRTQRGNGEPVIYTDPVLHPNTRSWEIVDGLLIQRVQNLPTPLTADGATHPFGASILRANFLSQRFGRYEWDVKLPFINGCWPGLWLAASNNRWPSGGEIDVCEAWRDDRKYLRGDTNACMIWAGADGRKRQYIERLPVDRLLGSPINLVDEFHRHAVDWRPDLTTWLIDDEVVWQARTRCHQPMYPLMDVTMCKGFTPKMWNPASGSAELITRSFTVYQ